MRSPGNCWTAFSNAQIYHCRPSELYAITDPVQAFCFDRAIFVFGTALKAELDKVEGKKREEIERKRQRIIARWIPEASAGFRDPGSSGIGVL